MAIGTETIKPVHMSVGPGNAFGADAKRQLFGKVAIDLFAGPTEPMISTDTTVDPEICATDMLGQPQHGYNSPPCMIRNNQKCASDSQREINRLLVLLRTRETADASWCDYGDIILCDSHEEMLQVAIDMAYEHVQVMTDRDDWY